ncbi:hypothetical protein LTR70_003120 [Exophiala xenobiotica]|uniref:Uncharacterized protein n=1 Tax=Lithohypha guttulata TaxID=1690604 RepID=A0ABR0KH67_9EURO|nr:hypothetical protein LTR24_002648 [Lithohypha guttulata]KAK5323831.1 hypothetical protein LTR70_003120 [Exophiala xenobiotica]
MEGGPIFILALLGLVIVIPMACCVFASCELCCYSAAERGAIEARRQQRYENHGATRRAEARARRARAATRDLEANIELQDRRPRPRTPPPAYVSLLPPAYGSVGPPPPVYGAPQRGFELTIRAARVPGEVYVGAGRGARF